MSGQRDMGNLTHGPLSYSTVVFLRTLLPGLKNIAEVAIVGILLTPSEAKRRRNKHYCIPQHRAARSPTIERDLLAAAAGPGNHLVGQQGKNTLKIAIVS